MDRGEQCVAVACYGGLYIMYNSRPNDENTAKSLIVRS